MTKRFRLPRPCAHTSGDMPYAPRHRQHRPRLLGRPRCRRRRWHPGDRGTVATELVLVVPVLVVLLLTVVYAGRVTRAQTLVREAASRAARAASLRQTEAAAAGDARAVALANLGGSRVSCSTVSVTVDADLRPGGSVAVTVRCTADLDGLGLLGVPGSRTLTATATQVVDTWRGG